MKDVSQETLERQTEEISQSALEWIGFVLRKLYADKDRILAQEVVRGLSFEELIGALLAARQAIRSQEDTR